MKKNVTPSVTAVFMAVSLFLLPFSVEAQTTVSVNNLANLQAQVANAPTNGTVKTITLTAAITIIGNTTIKGPAGSKVTIRRGVNATSLFIVNSGAALAFENIAVDGNKSAYASNAYPIVWVDGGAFTLNSDAVLHNNQGEYGGGIYVRNNGTVTMNGGEIRDNTSVYSGGVHLSSGAFTMNGGTISGNIDTDGNAGGVAVFNGTFTMTGGVISGNTCEKGAGGVSIYNNSDFNMNSGEISDNTGAWGGGVAVYSGSSFTMNKGVISGNEGQNTGGGVVAYDEGSTFVMNDGEISDNTGAWGGGVAVYSGSSFTMNKGVIKGNEGQNTGGGVYVYNDGSTFIMNDGEISNNTAGFLGGGVFVYNGGAFSMNDGEVSDNTCDASGGVFVQLGDFTMKGGKIINNISKQANAGGVTAFNCTFIMTDGTISGNTAADDNVGGVLIRESTFIVGGKSVIRDNKNDEAANASLSNVYIRDGNYITLGTGSNGAAIPSSGMEVWVLTETSNGVIVNSGASAGQEDFFHADDFDKMIVYDNGKLVIVDAPTGNTDVPQNIALKAWMQGNVLKVGGLTPGKLWSVYNLSGSLIYQNITDSDTSEIMLPVQGIYIIQSAGSAIKVVH